MPKTPKWMADAFEALFSGSYHPVQVTYTEMLTKTFKKVRFEGDLSKIKKHFSAGNIIEFRVSDTQFRHYTPSYFNQEKGVCEVLFYVHNQGVGSKWVEQLKVGDNYKLIGPGGKTALRTDVDFHFIFGDETSLGLMECLTREIPENYYCLAELDDKNLNIADELDFEIETCKKSTINKAQYAIEKTKEFLNNYQGNKENIAFYLTGNAKSIANLRNTLTKLGINQKTQIQTEPYWVEGKQGL
ncbi:siderophore-interacting protein [Riemerella anatipestifer]|uniref:FAD-binding FR-type domain-containing protein n=6 Tax=Riemerella anatipestifer TaxID=34085 RepID=J9R776_RIEAN|nr:FAD-binding oxidoreductase [Riemerella anatipestifer]ADQ82438.1 Oxidoreductase FAD-binding domain protein [Riemerella anatipestifer ATCC 11845 = DSM 15868]ADZ12068.1 oxidoreductase FAD-binding subunit [Riemerella anatipestifer RA-GD]AFD56443.1 oxidoreductase faD-binding domain protein [Riemerella anatipestifer ATCC 11845 = DSM 15868]AFR35212.1 hypothetical protein B739_0608 [Riemerella anatipestifer RA-CH-1]AGC39627.1 hypothetical protein G148_0322 [Riemerella anatipestifer RA-CH-2]